MFLVKWFIRKYLTKFGPIMFSIRDEWHFIDRYGKEYRIRQTGQYDIPLSITLIER